MSSLNSGVYAIEHRPSGRLYVGSSVKIKSRWASHLCDLRKGKHHSRHLQSAWNKYGESAFAFRVLLWCDPQSRFKYEQACIEAFDVVSNGFNCTPVAGSRFGSKHTEETKKKLSHIGKGRPHTESQKAAISKALIGNKNNLGKKQSEKQRNQTKERMIGNAFGLGKKMPESFLKALSARNIGNTYGKVNKGKPKSEEAKAAMRVAQKKRWENYRAKLLEDK